MRQLSYWTEEIAAKIKAYDPDAKINITRNTYEGEDAYILVETVKNALDLMHAAQDVQGEAILEGYFIPVLPTKLKNAVGM